jgi:class 3 adenylate cyclase
LFSDIRGFTTISEGMPPEELFSFLNEYLANMQISIDANGGFVDKFIGDAIMALFDQEESEQADSAVKAAIGMQRRLTEWNKERSGPPHTPILQGIGIHTGHVMMGTLGSDTRIDSTVIGDAVNLASRLESLTKYYGVGIIVSGDTYDLLDHDIFESREIDFVAVKGKTQPMIIHEIYQHLDGAELERHRRLCEEFRGAMELYRSRSWNDAVDAFRACREISPNDKTSALYIERCEYYAENPPEADWDGSFIMKSK